MKIPMFVMSLLTGFSLLAHATVLVPAKVIPTQIMQNSFNWADYAATMSITCQYQSGLFWPTPAACGSASAPVQIDENGSLLVPAISAFDSSEGQDLNNFQIVIGVGKKVKDPNEPFLFLISMNNKNQVQSYRAETGTLQILRLQGASLQVLINGQDLATSSLIQDQESELFASIYDRNLSTGFDSSSLLVDSDSQLQSYNNQSYEPPQLLLSHFTKYQIGAGAITQFSTAPRAFALQVILSTRSVPPSAEDIDYSAMVPFAMTADGFGQIQSVNLQK